MARSKSALALGIAQFPLRRFFYDLSAPSSRAYQRLHGLPHPMDYTERDFVALAALGITRAGTPITLRLSAKGLQWQARHALKPVAGRRLVVLNIGCGTEDALPKRPALAALVQALAALFVQAPFDLHLSGAGFEAEVNTQFVQMFQAHLQTLGAVCTVQDWAGQLSIEESAALLAQADVVVSSDSGPYHMAVALGVPTLCWFNFATPPSYHHQAGVCCLVQPDAAQFTRAALGLLSSGSDE
jgi:ADP-heptose:LPS heptosyltransferase